MQDYIGQHIDRYHITERLGVGGMGVVYKAFDIRLERDVALKLIKIDEIPASQHQKLLKRFNQEARTLANFNHPHIVPAFNYGEYKGVPYLVLGYMPNGTLKERIGGGFQVSEALDMLIPIADAIAYAHRMGVLHRDIKPSNIIFSQDNTPMLTDFGISKVLETTEATLTGTGFGVGTPEYMAPEQWQGKAVEASDQYALGVVLYELLTGQKPFTADTPLAVAYKQISEPLPRPSELNPAIPEDVEKVLYKVLARKPLDRFENMKTFQQVLEELLLAPEERTTVVGETPQIFAINEARMDIPQPDSEAETIDKLDEGSLGLLNVNDTSVSQQQRAVTGSSRQIFPAWLLWSLVVVMGIGLLTGGIILFGHIGDVLQGNTQVSDTPVSAIIPTEVRELESVVSTESASTPSPTSVVSETNNNNTNSDISSLIVADNPIIDVTNVDKLEEIALFGKGSISDLAWSPDGSTIAVVGSIGIYFYDSQAFQEVMYIEVESWVNSVAYSPDSSLLATGSRDGIIRLWDVSSGDLVRIFDGHSYWVNFVAFSPDGSRIASASSSDVYLWDVKTGELVNHLQEHTGQVVSIAFSPDSKKIVSVDNYFGDNTILTWDPVTGLLLNIRKSDSSSMSMAFSPDGNQMAMGGYSGITLWYPGSGELITTMSDDDVSSYNKVFFSPVDSLIASIDIYDIRLWDANSGKLIKTLGSYPNVIERLDFSPDGKQLASVSHYGNIQIWDLESGQLLKTMEEHTMEIKCVDFSPDGSKLASMNSYETIHLRDTSSGKLLHILDGKSSPAGGLAFSSNGAILASGGNNAINLWDADSGQLIMFLELGGPTYGDPVNSVAFSIDDFRLASGSWNGGVKLWDVDSGSLLSTLEGHDVGVTSVAFSPDGVVLASGGGWVVHLWDVEKSNLLGTLEGHNGEVYSLAFSPDGALLASASDDNNIRLWDASSKQLISTIEGNSGSVKSIVFSPNGQLLASGSWDGTIHLWDVGSGQLLRTLVGHTSLVNSISFSSNGRLLVSGSNDGTVRLWGVH